MEVRHLIIVQDQDFNESLYAAGERFEGGGGDTVYATDICSAVEHVASQAGTAIAWQISMVEVEIPDGHKFESQWPEKFEELMPFLTKASEHTWTL